VDAKHISERILYTDSVWSELLSIETKWSKEQWSEESLTEKYTPLEKLLECGYLTSITI